VRDELFTAVLLIIQVFRDVTLYRLPRMLRPEDEGKTIFRNIGIYQSTRRKIPEKLEASTIAQFP
jgi:hypothetical protein